MKYLSEMPEGSIGKIVRIDGDKRFLSRITSIGLTLGNKIEIIKNQKSQPLLIFGRDTLVAVNRRESKNIIIEEG